MPTLHHAVLDHEADSAFARVLHERREDPLGLTEVVGDAASRVATDERAHRHAAERCCSVDAGAEMLVVALALCWIGREVVVVVRECGEDEAVVGQGLPDPLFLGRVEGVGLDVARGERPVAERGPGGELEGLVPACARPDRDLLEAAIGHAGGQEAELHDVPAIPAVNPIRGGTLNHR